MARVLINHGEQWMETSNLTYDKAVAIIDNIKPYLAGENPQSPFSLENNKGTTIYFGNKALQRCLVFLVPYNDLPTEVAEVDSTVEG